MPDARIWNHFWNRHPLIAWRTREAEALVAHSATLLLRALREFVEREGQSHAATEVEQMLERAAPADVMRELEA